VDGRCHRYSVHLTKDAKHFAAEARSELHLCSRERESKIFSVAAIHSAKGAILSLALNSEPCQVTVGKADLPTDRQHSRRFRIESVQAGQFFGLPPPRYWHHHKRANSDAFRAVCVIAIVWWHCRRRSESGLTGVVFSVVLYGWKPKTAFDLSSLSSTTTGPL
jgi:hypothetical protein